MPATSSIHNLLC